MAQIEICKHERGVTDMVKETLMRETRFGLVVVYVTFQHDHYTFAPNLPDSIPAIFHDFGWRHKITQAGKPLTREQWDLVFLDLCRESDDWITRVVGPHYYRVLRLIDRPLIDKPLQVFGKEMWKKALPIPPEFCHLYQQTPFNLPLGMAHG